MKRVLFLAVLSLLWSNSAFAGTATACHCEYEGISGDYALILGTYNFEAELVNSRKVGTYFAESQCLQTAISAQACGQVRGGSQYCDCSYDAISGDYQLTRYISNEDGEVVLTAELAQYFGQSQCTNAALSLPACY